MAALSLLGMLGRKAPKAEESEATEQDSAIRRQDSSSGLLSLDDDGDAEIVISGMRACSLP